jgi:acetylornithine deacetylase/succinyl-diaminopimelate desuccinylase-like protein
MRKLVLSFFVASVSAAHAAASMDYDSAAKSLRKTLAELVAADTTNPPGNEVKAVKVIAARLQAEKIPYEITEFAPGRQNIVARLKGDGSRGKPLLLVAHIDVVGAGNQAWTVPPHELTEKDGFYYGRGVSDDLGFAVINLETFIAIKKSGQPLKRDLILAMTGDEESGGEGIRYLLKHKPESVNAGIALNEGGDAVLSETGKMVCVGLGAAEKTYQDFKLEAKGTTGHASAPRADNAIYKLAKALAKLSAYHPKERLIPVTRAYFRERAKVETGEKAKAMRDVANAKGTIPAKALAVLKKEPSIAAQFYTTCVATMLNGGTRVNALPATASANVNCRVMPDEKVEDVQALLRKIVADPEVEISMETTFGSAPASSLDGEVPKAIGKVTQEMWPGVPVIPSMANGATDSRYLRQAGVASYGIGPYPMTEADGTRAHGIDERLPVASARAGLEFVYRLTTDLVF